MGGGPEITERLLCVLPFPEPKEVIHNIREKFPYIEITYIHLQKRSESSTTAEDQVPDSVYHDKTILTTGSSLPSKPEACPNLKLIHFFAAGINYIVKHPIYTDTSITLTTSSGVHGPQIAEWVILTHLAQSHKYNDLYELQKRKRWGEGNDSLFHYRVRDLVGQRLGILGYGSIGRQGITKLEVDMTEQAGNLTVSRVLIVGRVAKAMGMDVIAFTATPKDTAEKRKDHGYIVPGTGDPDGSIPSEWFSGLDKESLHRFLSQDLDALLVSVPLTKDTSHLISGPELSFLGHRQAFLSNISRGKVIDQPALVKALEDHTLRGAALDVTDPEPLPATDPLWDAPNVTITPHISGAGEAYANRAFQILEINLERLRHEQPLINVVDRRRGY